MLRLWSYVRRLLLLLLLAISVVLGLWFASENSQQVAITLFGFTLPLVGLGFCLLVALVLGGVLGVAAAFAALLLQRKRHFLQVRKLRACEKELSALRKAALR